MKEYVSARNRTSDPWFSEGKLYGRLRLLGHRDICLAAFKTLSIQWSDRECRGVSKLWKNQHAAIHCIKLMYWNRLSDKICISFTNVEVINYCLQNYAWIHKTTIKCKYIVICYSWQNSYSFKRNKTSVPVTKQVKETYIFIFNFFTCFLFLTAQYSPCKWNQAWPFTCRYCCFRPPDFINHTRSVYIYSPSIAFKRMNKLWYKMYSESGLIKLNMHFAKIQD